MTPVETLLAERKTLLFSVGSVRMSLRLSHVREILAVADPSTEVEVRGATVPVLPIGVALGLRAVQGTYVLISEANPPLALRVDTVHGIVDLSQAEVFQLPARTSLPQPPPFEGAVVVQGEIALDLSLSALGWAPIEPAPDMAEPPPDLGSSQERELWFSRAGRTYAVPLSLLVHVLEGPRIWPVPLTPPAHRGLLYHGRAIHPIFDVALLYGDRQPDEAARDQVPIALLLDAGGAPVGVLADRVLGVGEVGRQSEVVRPAWDALFAS
jgi:chemotaxis signal transduction protein